MVAMEDSVEDPFALVRIELVVSEERGNARVWCASVSVVEHELTAGRGNHLGSWHCRRGQGRGDWLGRRRVLRVDWSGAPKAGTVIAKRRVTAAAVSREQ